MKNIPDPILLHFPLWSIIMHLSYRSGLKVSKSPDHLERRLRLQGFNIYFQLKLKQN